VHLKGRENKKLSGRKKNYEMKKDRNEKLIADDGQNERVYLHDVSGEVSGLCGGTRLLKAMLEPPSHKLDCVRQRDLFEYTILLILIVHDRDLLCAKREILVLLEPLPRDRNCEIKKRR
jgi:hypothetical protein